MTITTAPAPLLVDTLEGEHDRFAHWAKMADIMRAYVTGEPVRALCGKWWIPNRDPERYPICPTCAEIKAARGNGAPVT